MNEDLRHGFEQTAIESARRNAHLVSRILDDPEQGLAQLYDRYSRTVNRLVWRLLGPDADHDDIVQQAFLRMIQAIGKLRDPELLTAWVRAITVNVVRSELRKRSVRRAFSRGHEELAEVGNLIRDVESREFVQRSVALLNKLPTQERIVFALYYLEELSLPEVAESCGFSTMTAKRRLAAARSRIEKLARHEPLVRDFFDAQGALR